MLYIYSHYLSIHQNGFPSSECSPSSQYPHKFLEFIPSIGIKSEISIYLYRSKWKRAAIDRNSWKQISRRGPYWKMNAIWFDNSLTLNTFYYIDGGMEGLRRLRVYTYQIHSTSGYTIAIALFFLSLFIYSDWSRNTLCTHQTSVLKFSSSSQRFQFHVPNVLRHINNFSVLLLQSNKFRFKIKLPWKHAIKTYILKSFECEKRINYGNWQGLSWIQFPNIHIYELSISRYM